ncbi:MAG: hypothetical protein GXO98_00335, partial [Nitrospirae bacterium]|nr:hypothetical protein [Nitrospirota bacterium]
MLSDIRIVEIEPIFKKEKFRTPLKFGTGHIEEITSVVVRAKVENRKGRVAEGWGNILLSDLWAFPSEKVAHEERDKAMQQLTAEFCRRMATSKKYGHPVDLYLEAKSELLNLAGEISKKLNLAEPLPVLAALVCGSPVDAALHDGFGQVNEIETYAGYGPEFMEHDLSRYLGKEFKGKFIADFIKKEYTRNLPVFHLVGGMDKLLRSEVDETDPQDGLPVSLEEWIDKEGIFCFKVKLTGKDIAADVERTKAVADVASQGRDKFYLSIDPNEMCSSPEVVIEYLYKLREVSPLAFENLLYIEQPTERELGAHHFDMAQLAKLKPVLADEGITDVDTFQLARKLNWSGVALKTCKGHSAALLYVALCQRYNMIYSVQDLTNPGLSLIQSVGLAARIEPVMGVEYNSR